MSYTKTFFYFKTDVVSIKPKNLGNSVTINFPTSLINEGILIESQSPDQKPLLCEYFVQVGAHDGIMHDQLHKFLSKNEWSGILVEPQ